MARGANNTKHMKMGVFQNIADSPPFDGYLNGSKWCYMGNQVNEGKWTIKKGGFITEFRELTIKNGCKPTGNDLFLKNDFLVILTAIY